MGTAPGMLFMHDDKLLISMPGVPYEMKSIMSEEVLPLLEKEYIKEARYKKTIKTVGYGESDIAERINDIIKEFPDHISIAYLPGLGQVRLRISGSGGEKNELQKEVDSFVVNIVDVLGNIVYGYDNESLEEAVGKLLVTQEKTVAFAESCTGGYLSHRVTSVPGSSQYLEGSFVTYSYSLKEKLLDVKPETLKSYGAVSEETVKWLALSDGEKILTKKLSLSKDREQNIKYTSIYALNLLRKFLIGEF